MRALQGDAQLSLGKIDEAAASFATAVQADPNNLRAQLGLARLMAVGGKLDDAAQSVDAIIAKHPQAAKRCVAFGDSLAVIARAPRIHLSRRSLRTRTFHRRGLP